MRENISNSEFRGNFLDNLTDYTIYKFSRLYNRYLFDIIINQAGIL